MSSGAASEDVMGLVRQVMHRLRRHAMAALEPYGLTPHQSRAFLTISRADASEPLRLKDLADLLHIAPRSATEVVDALESRGLVARTPAPGDRRAVALSVTPLGRQVAVQVRAAQADQPMLEALTAAERAELSRLLTKLTEHDSGCDHRH